MLGWKYAIPVLLINAGKGTVAAVFISRIAGHEPWMPLVVGTAAILGHVFTAFLRFKGGKGVATAAGVVLGVAPVPLGICGILWLVVVLISGYGSLGSIIASAAFPIVTRIFDPGDPYAVKVLDLGFGQLRDATVTTNGTVAGGATHMAPEQCVADEVDARTDVYALGLVMYQAFTGKPAFEGEGD